MLRQISTLTVEQLQEFHKQHPDKLSKSTCKKYADVLRIPGVIAHIGYGIDGLAMLSSVLRIVDDLNSEDPITDFITRFGISPSTNNDVEKTRFEIEVAMAIARLEKAGLDVPRDLVRHFMEKGFHLTKKDLVAMKDCLESGASPATYLEKVLENG